MSGRPFIPSASVVTPNGWMLDLGIWLAQSSSGLGVGNGTPSPTLHLESCEDRGCARGQHYKRGENERATLCSG